MYMMVMVYSYAEADVKAALFAWIEGEWRAENCSRCEEGCEQDQRNNTCYKDLKTTRRQSLTVVGV